MIMETLGSMITVTDYNVLVALWNQMIILLKHEFVTEQVDNALTEINKIITPIKWQNEKFAEDIVFVNIKICSSTTKLYTRSLQTCTLLADE